MGVVKKQGFLTSIATYVGLVIGYLNTALLFPQFLGPERFGLVQLLISISMIISKLAAIGTPQTIIKFFPFFKDNKAQAKSFFTIIFVMAVSGSLVFSGIFYLLRHPILSFYADNSALLIDYQLAIYPMMIFMVVFEVLFSYSLAHLKSVAPTIARNVVLRLLNLALICLFIFEVLDFDQFLNGVVLAYGAIGLFLGAHLFKNGLLDISFNTDVLKGGKGGEMVNYGLFSFLTGISLILVEKIDLVMLGAYEGLANTGIYALAFFITNVITIPADAISLTIRTLVAQAFKDEELDKVDVLYKKTSIVQLVIGALMMILILLVLDVYYHWVPEYSEGKMVIVWIGLAKLFHLSTGCNGIIIMNSHYYRYMLWLNLLLIGTAIAANAIFIPLYGIEGAAFATAITFLINNVLKVGFLYWRYGLLPFDKGVLPVLVLFGTGLALVFFVPQLGGLYVDAALKCVLFGSVFLLAIYKLRVSEDVNELIDKVLIQLRIKH